MRRIFQVLGIGLLACLWVACGKTITTPGTGNNVGQGEQTPMSTTKPTQPPGANGVSLTIDQTALQTTGVLTVTIQNDGSQTITGTDHHTNCTMVTVQQQINGVWTDLAPCKQMIATRAIDLAPQKSITQHVGSGPQTASSRWASGNYRVTFTYFFQGASNATMSATATFVVN